MMMSLSIVQNVKLSSVQQPLAIVSFLIYEKKVPRNVMMAAPCVIYDMAFCLPFILQTRIGELKSAVYPLEHHTCETICVL